MNYTYPRGVEILPTRLPLNSFPCHTRINNSHSIRFLQVLFPIADFCLSSPCHGIFITRTMEVPLVVPHDLPMERPKMCSNLPVPMPTAFRASVRQEIVESPAPHLKLRWNVNREAISLLRKQNTIQLGLQRVKYQTPLRIRGHRFFRPQAKRDSTTELGRDSSTAVSKEGNQGVVNPLSGLLDGISNAFKGDDLGWEISVIALPSIVALAAEPIASLVDTAFIGYLGPVELAAVGVSISIFNVISKLFNIPLLNVTTSFVAEDEALRGANEQEAGTQIYSDWNKCHVRVGTRENSELEKGKHREALYDGNDRQQLPAVSAALVLAVGLGVIEATTLCLGAGFLLNLMGVPAGSPMHLPAEQYLTLRGLGAPAVVVSLAVQGVFRGFKDTKTPLYATGAGNVLNAILVPIFMFTLGFGVSGAAIATVVSQYFIAFILLWSLNKQVVLIPHEIEELQFDRYLQSGGLLLGRTVAVLGTMTLGTSMAARQGPIPMAGHQICLQVWLAVSLLTDSLALAGQSLLASAFSKRDHRRAKNIIFRVLQIGLVLGIALALILFAGFKPFSKLFTTDTAVLEIVASGVLFVAGTQPINALAFVFDGLYYGVSDFAYATYSMIAVGIVSSVVLVVAPSILGLAGVWAGLTLFMSLRMVAGFLRLEAKNGPWQFLQLDMEKTEI